jgi:hypothetical protein
MAFACCYTEDIANQLIARTDNSYVPTLSDYFSVA